MCRRRLQNLDKPAQARLAREFPDLLAILRDGGAPGYQQRSISVFDHWLSREEAFEQLADVPGEAQAMHDARLHAFVCSLTSVHEAFALKRTGRYKQHLIFRQFRTALDRSAVLTPASYNLWHWGRFVFVIPGLRLLYTEDWDFTHHVYMQDLGALDVLQAEAAKAGVHVI